VSNTKFKRKNLLYTETAANMGFSAPPLAGQKTLNVA
jgi:hypothetical protein